MPQSPPAKARFCLRTTAIAACLTILGGCASSGSGLPETDNPVKNIAKATNFATDLPQPKDFVLKSRPAPESQNFIPVHERPPVRTEAVLTPAGVKARQKELEAVGKKHDLISGRPIEVLKKTKSKKRNVPPASG